MAAKRIEIMDIRQILQLKNKDVSNRQIAITIGIHRNSINNYVRLFNASGKSYEALLSFTDEELQDLFPLVDRKDKAKYEELKKQFSYFQLELKKPGCTRQILWQAYLVQYPDGYGYTQFTQHLNSWLKSIKPSGKLNHKAGDKVYIDYTGKKLSYVDKVTGELIEVEVFVGILPCSGYTFVQASSSQKLNDFITSMNNCLLYFGGVPQAIVPDNLKSAVTKGSKYEPTLNKTFKDLALHYGCAINPTRTYSPKDKALVEGAVKLVYQRIFYPLDKMTFFSLADLNKEIARLLESYNDRRLTHLQISRRQQFQELEQSFLSSLPNEIYEIKQYRKATVQNIGYVFLNTDKNYYSVPYRFIGKQVQVSYTQQTVEICYKNQRIATHKRSFRPGHYLTIEDHLSSTHKFYQNWSPAFFEKLAAPHGTEVVQYIQALIKQATYPEIAYKQCLGIVGLKKCYPSHRINDACKRGLTFHRYGYHIIKNILDNNMDMEQLDALSDNANSDNNIIPEHDNIRGATYYQ